MSSGVVNADVCVLGAGPHGLAAALHLREADPDIRIAAIDPSGGWLTTWFEQFARAEIGNLRSPIVHHPASDPFALADFVARNGLAASGLPYNLPTTDAFAQFCRSLIESAGLESPLADTAHTIRSALVTWWLQPTLTNAGFRTGPGRCSDMCRAWSATALMLT